MTTATKINNLNVNNKTQEKKKKKAWTKNDYTLFIMASLSVIFLAVFAYLPMFGIILAFKDGDGQLDINKAMFATNWVGLENFANFLNDSEFQHIMINTICLNVLQLIICFPAPIIFALLLNEIRLKRFKKGIQTVSYMPHFISWIIFGGIFLALINADTGIINQILVDLHIVDKGINFEGDPQYFYAIVIISSLLKGIGWGSIIYLAAITGIDPNLYEAARIDGANRFQCMLNITLPSIAPQITLFLLLSISSLLNNGVEQILVFQNQMNLATSEVIDTFVLKYGLGKNMYSYATAVGLFKSIIGFFLIISSNFFAKKVTGEGII